MIPIKDDNPTEGFPLVTVSIIVLNVIVFLIQIMNGPAAAEVFIYRTAAIPYEITHLIDIAPFGPLWPPFTLVSSVFVHADFLHLGGNMLFLWIFGDNIEERLGRVRFIVFYLFAGLVASFTQILADPNSTIPMIGASGAVAGILGVYFLLFPKAHVITLVWIAFFVKKVRIPAVIFLGLWFALQVLSSLGGGDGIAWYAHIGGFMAGIAVVFTFGRLRAEAISKRPRFLRRG